MIRVIYWLTLRQLLGQRRTLLLVLLAAVPILLSVVYFFAANPGYLATGSAANPVLVSQNREWVAKVLLDGHILSVTLPRTALILGTAVLGPEIEDGTAVYLLAKPIPRWQVLAGKGLAAWSATLALVLPAAIIAAVIALAAPAGPLAPRFQPLVDNGSAFQLVGAFVVATAAAAFAYCALFILLSLVTSRAFIAGLIYVLLWEGLVTRLFQGTRILSIRQYSRGLAKLLANVDPRVFDARLAGGASIVLLVAVSALAAWLAVRRLERFEIGETS